ncbi:MAG: hypothetical protein HY270_11115 [Deltaproteobacteria bacterium]|nr:hypothetical protein [Deltaproteobacteria bacterium]
MKARWNQILALALLCMVGHVGAAIADAPPQKLPSALLMFPYVDSGGGVETRIELVNLSGGPVNLQCFFVNSESELCNEIGFFLTLTPYQPMAWVASEGVSDEGNATAAPPFFGTGELKCAVMPAQPTTDFYNTIQGRATVYHDDGETVSYSAVGFLRLRDGEYAGALQLNNGDYTQCPDKLHFDVLTDQPATPSSELILLPCTEDLLLQIPTMLNVQLLITNEFEQTFSTSYSIKCFSRRAFSDIADSLTRAAAGTETAHISVRGSQGPLIGLVIDSVPFQAINGVAGNEPSLQGGRSATVTFPQP